MSMLRVISSALGCAGHWIGETYCTMSQKIAERIEQVSDTIAEQRHLAQHVEEHPCSVTSSNRDQGLSSNQRAQASQLKRREPRNKEPDEMGEVAPRCEN